MSTVFSLSAMNAQLIPDSFSVVHGQLRRAGERRAAEGDTDVGRSPPGGRRSSARRLFEGAPTRP
jgi:hypothetical protein